MAAAFAVGKSTKHLCRGYEATSTDVVLFATIPQMKAEASTTDSTDADASLEDDDKAVSTAFEQRVPRLLTMSSNIGSTKGKIDAEFALNECLEFVWMKGGGLPVPPPLPYGETVDKHSRIRRNLLRIPPFITESIINTAESKGKSEFRYTLNSPGWATFPFLMHSHIGRVEFCKRDDDSLSITWEVEIIPYLFVAPFVEKLVEMTVSTLLRNLRVRLTEPGSCVVIKPPRGNTNWLLGRKNFGSVPKETWLGGVLDVHLSDDRSTIEQSLAMLQPWTWGRTGTGDDTDVVRFRWSG
eukprot:CCRYP_006187-RA/>CCRYP_006187-RA protein AED:0.16 eAED:0.16 QI:0/-1/0/1/-1/1/1/0/296